VARLDSRPVTSLSDPAVSITGLITSYGSTRAVDGLSATFPRGAVTAVLGPNGAGKTTTLETCEGFRRADSGTVEVLGLDPRRDAHALRPRVGVMLQAGGVYPAARAVEMVRHVASLYATPLDVAALATRLGLDRIGRTPFRRMSGGEQQRVRLACAIVGRPELVFLDEPTSGLDPQGRADVWELVDQLRSDGVTVVLSTHLMEEAERLSDHVVIVDRGRVVAEGSPVDLTASSGVETLTFRGPLHLDATSLTAALPEGCVVTEGPPGTYRMDGSVDPQVLAAVTAWCAGHGVMPRDLAIGRRTLEDVFLELTGRELAP
jgi:ABC-2 type transport system ATP-binding protein